MGSGGEGSPSPPTAAAKNRSARGAVGRTAPPKSPSSQYKLQREELLGGSSPRVLSPCNGLPRASISPRPQITPPNSTNRQPAAKKGASQLHNRHSLPPTASLNISASPDFVDSQQSMVRDPPLQKNPKPEPQDDGPPVNPNPDNPDIPKGQLSPRDLELKVWPLRKDMIVFLQSYSPEAFQATQQKFPISPDWAVPGATAECLDVQEIKASMDNPGSCPLLKPSKIFSRRERTKADETEEQDLDTMEKNRRARRTRQHAHRQKRKALDSDPDLALASVVPDPGLLPQESFAPPQSARVDQCYSRRDSRGRRSELERPDWLQFSVDIVLWRDVPKSSLLFGIGCFSILSGSLMQDLEYSIMTLMAYVALVYLAVAFLRHTFGPRVTSDTSTAQSVFKIGEADANRVVNLLLPVINMIVIKFSEVFSGEPAMTLKVAAILWFLAQAGSVMSLWTLARLAYFCLFIIPKCYACYHIQLHTHAENILLWGWATWDSCSHKKALLIAALVAAWNFCSLSSRICGAFTFIVAFRVYHHSVRTIQQAEPNKMKLQTFSAPPSSEASHGLQLTRLPPQSVF